MRKSNNLSSFQEFNTLVNDFNELKGQEIDLTF